MLRGVKSLQTCCRSLPSRFHLRCGISRFSVESKARADGKGTFLVTTRNEIANHVIIDEIGEKDKPL